MIWKRFCQTTIAAVEEMGCGSSFNRIADRINSHLAWWGFGIHAPQLVIAWGLNFQVNGTKQEIAMVLLPIISILTYVHDAHKAIAENNQSNSFMKRARLLAKDRSLEPDWRRRAKVVHSVAQKLEQKEKRYGSYEEIRVAREKLDKAIDCIVRHNMILAREHAEVVQREVDIILNAYAELE